MRPMSAVSTMPNSGMEILDIIFGIAMRNISLLRLMRQRCVFFYSHPKHGMSITRAPKTSHISYLHVMKTMTCIELGGACNEEFTASTFEEIAELSKAHGMKMFEKRDEAHLNAMREMQELSKSPDAMQKWFAEKKAAFERK